MTTRIGVFLALAGTLVATGFIYWSFSFANWRRDVLLNGGFMLLGAVFTAAIVDILVARHQESRWEDARRVAWHLARTDAARLVLAIAKYYPDPSAILESPSRVTESQAKMSIESAGLFHYTNPVWIDHIRREAAPGYGTIFHQLDADQIDDLISTLRQAEASITRNLQLFSQLLNPRLIQKMLLLLDRLASEWPLLVVRRNEVHLGDGLPSSQPRAELSQILTLGVEIIEEVNKRFPPAVPD